MSLRDRVIALLFCLVTHSTRVQPADLKADVIDVESLHVTSYISYRFATTHVTSRLLNEESTAREIRYELQLPKEAFISKFSMLIGEVVYDATVKEKEAAKKEYERAKERGESAGHVVAKSRSANKFGVSVNVAGDTTVTFNLTYQELLTRRLGRYEHVIYIDPGQTVADMRVEVYMLESRRIAYVTVPPIRSDLLTAGFSNATNSLTVIERPTSNCAYVKYQPTEAQQRAQRAKGIMGQFVVQYDVDRDARSEVLVVNGYFVHFIAPKGLTPIPRDVLFVLDLSGSMAGRKLEQVKEAMLKILSDLHAMDRFNMAFFSDLMEFWKREFIPVTTATVSEARSKVRSLRNLGGTNLYDGLVKGIDFAATKSLRERAAILLFLTDGRATSGITDRARIIGDSARRNEGRVAMFGLAFGGGADYGLMKAVSARNNGVARKIYTDSDAALQLSGFYDEISTPLLSNVSVRYVGDSVDQTTVTQNLFFNYYDGGELVIAGRLDSRDSPEIINLVITADKAEGTFLEESTVSPTLVLSQQQLGFGEDVTQFSRKLWAYLTIKQLLSKLDQTDDAAEIKRIKQRALDLSLKYGFVTPLTSLVVTQPEGKDASSSKQVPMLEGSGRQNIRAYDTGHASRQTASLLLLSFYWLIVTTYLF